MRLNLAGAATVVLLSLAAAAEAEVAERKFVSGGTVRLELDAGEYEITPSPDDRIRVIWNDGRGDDGHVVVDIAVKGREANIETDTPWKDGKRIRIELPRRSHVFINLSAGELRISGIEGSKDISARAGEITIGVGSREQYRHVNASVRIGELNAAPFNVNQDGFFRSFDWSGRGPYELRAHLTVGELRLTR